MDRGQAGTRRGQTVCIGGTTPLKPKEGLNGAPSDGPVAAVFTPFLAEGDFYEITHA